MEGRAEGLQAAPGAGRGEAGDRAPGGLSCTSLQDDPLCPDIGRNVPKGHWQVEHQEISLPTPSTNSPKQEHR